LYRIPCHVFAPGLSGISTQMPGRLVEIRYPDNYFELEAKTESPPPAVGDTLHRRGRLWKVTSRAEGPPVILRVEAVDGLPPDKTPRAQ